MLGAATRWPARARRGGALTPEALVKGGGRCVLGAGHASRRGEAEEAACRKGAAVALLRARTRDSTSLCPGPGRCPLPGSPATAEPKGKLSL